MQFSPLRVARLAFTAILVCFALVACSSSDGPPPQSDNNDLSGLTVSPGSLSPAFSPGANSYSVSVANEVDAISVTATASDAAATVSVNGNSGSSASVSLAVGVTQISVEVRAEDGSTQTYSISVTREPSSDASLQSLTLSAASLNETFDSAVTDYTADTGESVDSTAVTAEAANDGATITVNGTEVPSGAASDPVPLSVGENTITIVVTAEDGTATTTYTIIVTRPDPAPVVSDVDVLVLTASGAVLDGATVSVDPGGATATTGTSGRATVAVEQESRQLIRVSAPGFLDQALPIELPANAAPSVFTIGLVAEQSPSSIVAAESGGSASGPDGASVTLPAGALVDNAGNPVTGAVDVFMTPIDVSDERAFRAFPGGFEALDDGGNPGFMLSFGTVDFRFEQNGTVLALAAGQTATIDIPLYVPNDADGTPLVEGAVIPLWSLDLLTSVWQQEGQGTVVASAASPTGLALRGEVTHFSWWNADRFRNPGDIRVIIDCRGLGPNCSASAPGLNMACQTSDRGRPQYIGQFALAGGAASPVLPVPGDTDLDCDAETDGAYTATTEPAPVNAPAASVLDVSLILATLHESGGAFTPGQRLRGEMSTVGEIHSYTFSGFAGEEFNVTGYPAENGLSEPGLTGLLGASVSVYQDTTLLATANFDTSMAGEVDVTLPADAEYEVRFEAQGKVPGWYVATTELRPPSASGSNGKVAFLAERSVDGRDFFARLYTVPEGVSPYLELSGPFVDDFNTDGVRRNTLSSETRKRPFFQEVAPGRIVYLADQDTPGKYELYVIDVERPGEPVKLNGAETANAEISEFKVSPTDPTRIVYRVGGEDSGAELWFVDTDSPGVSTRIAEPAVALYNGRQRHFEFAANGTAVVYDSDYTVESTLDDGELYIVFLDNPSIATRLSGPLDYAGGERVQRWVNLGAPVSADGNLVAYQATVSDGAGGFTSEGFLVDVATPGTAVRLDFQPGVSDRSREILFSPDGTKVVAETVTASGFSKGPVFLIDITDPTAPQPSVRLADSAGTTMIGPDSSFILLQETDQLDRVDFDAPGLRFVEWTFPLGGGIETFEFTPDGSRLVANIVNDYASGDRQLYAHVIGGGETNQVRLGPSPDLLSDSADGIYDFALAEDGDTVYYMTDLVFSEYEIFQTSITNPDGDRFVVAERLDNFPIRPSSSARQLPSFIILEPGQNPAP